MVFVSFAALKNSAVSLFIVIIGILSLIVLIGYFKLDTFISFILVSLAIGLAQGMGPMEISNSIQNGIGGVLGFLVIILGFGAMLGKMVADSGAAQRISSSLIQTFGRKYVQWALVLTGFIIGIPMFYSVGFVIMVPLVFTVAATTRLPMLYIGLPMLSALSVTHGYLPPHPAPTALVVDYGADLGLTMIYGIIVAIPAIILGGPVFSSTLKKYRPKPLAGFYNDKVFTEEEMPSLSVSILTALSPVILLGFTAILKFFVDENTIAGTIIYTLSDPVIAMLIAILIAIFTLGIFRGTSMRDIGFQINESIRSIAMILLIIAGAGALKQILVDSGVSDHIGSLLQNVEMSPLILAWGIAAIIRVCVGSATVAGLTAAGIVLPLIQEGGANPELMVLATGAGSLMFSHVNDGGFWMFKEYFNLSVKDTIKTWSVMETIVSVTGLIGVLILNIFV